MTEKQICEAQEWVRRLVDAGELFCRIAKERRLPDDEIMEMFAIIMRYWEDNGDTDDSVTDAGWGSRV